MRFSTRPYRIFAFFFLILKYTLWVHYHINIHCVPTNVTMCNMLRGHDRYEILIPFHERAIWKIVCIVYTQVEIRSFVTRFQSPVPPHPRVIFQVENCTVAGALLEMIDESRLWVVYSLQIVLSVQHKISQWQSAFNWKPFNTVRTILIFLHFENNAFAIILPFLYYIKS